MDTIYLIGFMGSGKTTIGKKLSQHMELELVDLDEYIEDKNKQTIKNIFAIEGEDAFRSYETQALFEAENGIIATGGGIIEKDVNRQFLQNEGTVIYLAVSFETIVERLKADENRPLWNANDEGKMEQLFNRRLALYEACADITVNVDKKSEAEITEEIVRLIAEKNS